MLDGVPLYFLPLTAIVEWNSFNFMLAKNLDKFDYLTFLPLAHCVICWLTFSLWSDDLIWNFCIPLKFSSWGLFCWVNNWVLPTLEIIWFLFELWLYLFAKIKDKRRKSTVCEPYVTTLSIVITNNLTKPDQTSSFLKLVLALESWVVEVMKRIDWLFLSILEINSPELLNLMLVARPLVMHMIINCLMNFRICIPDHQSYILFKYQAHPLRFLHFRFSLFFLEIQLFLYIDNDITWPPHEVQKEEGITDQKEGDRNEKWGVR